MIDPLRNPIFTLRNHERQVFSCNGFSMIKRMRESGSTLIAIIAISQGMCEQAEHVKSRRHKK